MTLYKQSQKLYRVELDYFSKAYVFHIPPYGHEHGPSMHQGVINSHEAFRILLYTRWATKVTLNTPQTLFSSKLLCYVWNLFQRLLCRWFRWLILVQAIRVQFHKDLTLFQQWSSQMFSGMTPSKGRGAFRGCTDTRWGFAVFFIDTSIYGIAKQTLSHT